MNRKPHPDLERFAASVASRLGYQFHPNNSDPMDEALRHALKRTGSSGLDAYLLRFKDPRFARSELREIAQDLAVAETYFFRHPEQLHAFAEVAVPLRMEARRATRHLSVLSAGCASGEEAYTVAAILAGIPGLAGWDLRLCGIDVNPVLLQKARRARYSKWSLRAVSEASRDRHFTTEGTDHLVHEPLRSAVRFEERNLVDDDPAFWRPGAFDVIFCRNVLIYFDPAATRALVERMATSLVPGGFLFLGPSETLRGISTQFHLRHTHGAFYYQRRSPDEPSVLQPLVTPANPEALPAPPSPGAREDLAGGGILAGVAAVAESARRIAALSRRLPGLAEGPATADAVVRPPSQGLETEIPRTAEADPDAQLLEAVVLVNSGDIDQAEALCSRLLVRDEFAPGAQYLRALCHDRRGDPLAAAEHDQKAIYLDGTFAMPRLHLGLLARRLGDLSTARRELAEALVLLAREDASRILLFGGGFGREALVRLCQAQLDRCGEVR